MKRKRSAKALRLNGSSDYVPMTAKLLASSSVKKKPTFKIRRGKLQSGSTLQRQLFEQERMKAEKALRLNGG
jgi:hypothetical protein